MSESMGLSALVDNKGARASRSGPIWWPSLHQLSSSLAEIRVGTLKALATTASKRIEGLPDVPTVRELGHPILEREGWNGLFAPAKTPKEISIACNARWWPSCAIRTSPSA